MHNETLASEIIKDQQETVVGIIRELDCMDVDFDKALFALGEAQEIIEDMEQPKTFYDGQVQYSKMKNILMYLNIVFDYVDNLQTSVSGIVLTNYKERQENKKMKDGGIFHE